MFTSNTNPEHWRRLLKVIGREDLLDDPRFASREARGEHEAEIDTIVSEWTRRHDKHEAMRLVGAAGVPAGAVLDTGELLGEPSFEVRGIMQTMQHPLGTLTADLSGAVRRRPAPRYGGAPAGRAQHHRARRLAGHEGGRRRGAEAGRDTVRSPELAGGDSDLRREWPAHGRS
jgi:crotonobetainyl-CoA:carnitine CoA-transferase CaiB-like acyl-CoA transferase